MVIPINSCSRLGGCGSCLQSLLSLPGTLKSVCSGSERLKRISFHCYGSAVRCTLHLEDDRQLQRLAEED